MTLENGTLLLNGSLQMEKLLGRGAYGEVYLINNAGALRAAKIIRKGDLGVGSSFFEQGLRRFTQEAYLGMRLSDRNATRVVRTFALLKDNEANASELYLLMEYMPGGTLADRLGQHPDGLPLEDAIRIAHDIATGLKELHALQAIHRDLKPSNVLFDADGNAKIGDLGLAELPRWSGLSLGGARMARTQRWAPRITWPRSRRAGRPPNEAAMCIRLGVCCLGC